MSVESVEPVEVHYEDYAIVLGNIRAEIARRRLSQTSIAAAMGQNQQWLSRRLIGYVPLSVPELLTLASIIGMNPRDLLASAWAPRGSNPQPTDYRTRHLALVPQLSEVA